MTKSIVNLLVAPWKTCVVFTAIRLRIFTLLSKRRISLEELSSICGAVPHLLKALLDACVSIGLLLSEEDTYANSDFSNDYLVEGKPRYVGDLIELQYSEANQWDKLYDVIVGGKNIIDKQHAEEIHDQTFYKAMNNLGMLGEAEALKTAIDLSGCKRMVDVGGGSGLYSIVLCREYPELKSTVLDKSDALTFAKEMMAGVKERDRITLREADITKEPFGKDIDVVLLSDVLYDESSAAPILKNAWDCLRQNGMLIIRGYYSDPENSKHLFGSLFVLGMLVFDPNRKIMTISSLQQNVCDIGFTMVKISPLTELSIVLIARR